MFIHRMSDSFDFDSPTEQEQTQRRGKAVATTPVKRKGGRAKEVDLARGIPQEIIDQFNLATPEHETDQ